MFKNKFLTFISFLFVTFSASVIGGLATINYKEPWYSLLNKPTLNPPDWVFGPVWTTLYLMMTIAIWLFWHSKSRDKNYTNDAFFDPIDIGDNTIPNGNAVMLINFTRLGMMNEA